MSKPLKPLRGVTVVSIEQAVSAPYATCRLADAGARVIKVERDTGDFARQYDEAVKGLATYFVWINRGKESVQLNIKDEADRLPAFCASQTRADVFRAEPGSRRPGKNRAGIPKVLRARNRGLITVDISGYGEEGDYSAMKALLTQPCVSAKAGLL